MANSRRMEIPANGDGQARKPLDRHAATHNRWEVNMTDNSNLRYWDRFDDIDPKFTKPITGKAYKGTSPNPSM